MVNFKIYDVPDWTTNNESLYKTVWQILITYCHKKVIDLLTQLLMLYHVRFFV